MGGGAAEADNAVVRAVVVTTAAGSSARPLPRSAPCASASCTRPREAARRCDREAGGRLGEHRLRLASGEARRHAGSREHGARPLREPCARGRGALERRRRELGAQAGHGDQQPLQKRRRERLGVREARAEQERPRRVAVSRERLVDGRKRSVQRARCVGQRRRGRRAKDSRNQPIHRALKQVVEQLHARAREPAVAGECERTGARRQVRSGLDLAVGKVTADDLRLDEYRARD